MKHQLFMIVIIFYYWENNSVSLKEATLRKTHYCKTLEKNVGIIIFYQHMIWVDRDLKNYTLLYALKT